MRPGISIGAKYSFVAVGAMAMTAALTVAPAHAVAGSDATGRCIPPICEPDDPHLTKYDKLILSQLGQGAQREDGGTYPNRANRLASAYCKKASFGDKLGQCQITSFHEEKRVSWMPNHRERVSGLQFNCTGSPSSKNLSWSFTNSATDTLGGQVSTSVSVKVSVAPFGVGADVTASASIAASYSHAWGESSTESGGDIMTIRPGYLGWFERADFYGIAHGVAEVTIKDMDPAYWPAWNQAVFPGKYRVVTDLKGDLVKPENPAALSAQPVVGIVAQERPMTSEEKNICASNTRATMK